MVFALQGFEQAVQVGGEARNPQKDISRAIITAMVIGTIIYLLLEIAFIGALDPASIVKNWDNPISQGSFGPYATLATLAGAGWLAYILYADAFVSPAGTGLLYLGTSSRLSYAMGREKVLPKQLGKLNIPYQAPAPNVLAPAGFVAANLIIYWTGFDITWKIMIAIVAGFVLFVVARATTTATDRLPLDWKAVTWIPPWLVGTVVIGWLGRYGESGNINALPEWIDLLVVILFSLVMFYWAVGCAMDSDKVKTAIDRQTEDLVPQP